MNSVYTFGVYFGICKHCCVGEEDCLISKTPLMKLDFVLCRDTLIMELARSLVFCFQHTSKCERFRDSFLYFL